MSNSQGAGQGANQEVGTYIFLVKPQLEDYDKLEEILNSKKDKIGFKADEITFQVSTKCAVIRIKQFESDKDKNGACIKKDEKIINMIRAFHHGFKGGKNIKISGAFATFDIKKKMIVEDVAMKNADAGLKSKIRYVYKKAVNGDLLEEKIKFIDHDLFPNYEKDADDEVFNSALELGL